MKRQLFVTITSLISLIYAYNQEIDIRGIVVNSNEEPVANVFIYFPDSPEISCYSNNNGEFQLNYTLSDINDINKELPEIRQNNDGSIEFEASNQYFNLDIFDLTGRKTGSFEHRKRITGNFRIYPGAYMPNVNPGIYIARVTLGEYQQGFLLSTSPDCNLPKGLIQTFTGRA
jgi:hypothetical protein